MRKFNVTGLCVPDSDYMVDISGKLKQIMALIDDGSYFTINRARQYGKTTTLNMLEKTLSSDYVCASISFQGVGDRSFETPQAFCALLMNLISRALRFTSSDDSYIESWVDADVTDFPMLDRHISKMCKDKKMVLLVDEVDKTSNNQIFLHFLGLLREKFLLHRAGKDHTFHSVVLAGVYDIKNIKLKMMNEAAATPAAESKILNSPWNISVDFDVDMSFSPAEIATMLDEYESDHNTGMDVAAMSNVIYEYTSGYPYLVSRLCKHIDEKLCGEWTQDGARAAVKIMLSEPNTLFDDIRKNLENNKKLYDFMYGILIKGKNVKFNIDDAVIDIASMYGLVKNADGKAAVSNRVFELRIADYFISTESHDSAGKQIAGVLQNDIVKDGRFDMELCLRKFAGRYKELFGKSNAKFFEEHGRLLFLMYLTPLINGQGFYHIESRLTDLRRMDLVVDFGRDQFIIELKLWNGDSKHEDAYEQLLGYMRSRGASDGYLLTFDFRKNAHKQSRAEWVEFGDRRVFDVVV